LNRPGRTPLMRAKKLEKYLGIEQIYLKLEGANPHGHKFDRVSEVIVKDATNHKDNGLFVDGPDDYINSIIQFCENNNLTVKIPLFKNERWKESIFGNDLFIDFRTTKISNKYELADKYCRDNNFYNASQYATRHLSMISLQKIKLGCQNFQHDKNK
jgi:threonine synthase